MSKQFVLILLIMLFVTSLNAEEITLSSVKVHIGGEQNSNNSPISRNSFMIGVNSSILLQSNSFFKDYLGEEHTNTIFTPEIGYFVTRGLVIGGVLKIPSLSQGKFDFSSFGVGSFLGYYFSLDSYHSNRRGVVYPFIKGSAVYNKISDDVEKTYWQYDGMTGVNIMITSAVTFQIGLQASLSSWKRENFPEALNTTSISGVAGVEVFIY